MMYYYDLNDPKYKNDIYEFIKHDPLIKNFRKKLLIMYYFFLLIGLLIEYLFSFFFYKDFWRSGYPVILSTFAVICILVYFIFPKIIYKNMTKSITLGDTSSIELNDNNLFYIINDRKINLEDNKNINIISASKLDSAIMIFFTLKEIGQIEYKLVLIPLDFFKTSKEVELFQESLLDK